MGGGCSSTNHSQSSNTVTTATTVGGPSSYPPQSTSGTSAPYPKRSPDGPAGLVLVLDSSGSIGSDGWTKTLEFSKEVTEGLRNKTKENLSKAVTWINSDGTTHKNLEEYLADPGATEVVHVGVVVYSSSATTHWDLNEKKSAEQLAQDIQNLEWIGGGTDTAQGLLNAEEIFKTSTTVYSKHIVVLITDGQSYDQNATIRQAENMHANGVEIFVVGVGNVNRQEMEQVSSQPMSEHCHYVPDFAALQATTEKIVTVTYTAVEKEMAKALIVEMGTQTAIETATQTAENGLLPLQVEIAIQTISEMGTQTADDDDWPKPQCTCSQDAARSMPSNGISSQAHSKRWNYGGNGYKDEKGAYGTRKMKKQLPCAWCQYIEQSRKWAKAGFIPPQSNSEQ